MNMLKFITKVNLVMSLTILSTIVLFAKSPRANDIKSRLEQLNTIVDVKLTEEVLDQVNLRVNKHRRDSEVILGRAELYFPYIEQMIREKNLPDDLKYIAVIESALLPYARSRQDAVGLWQFMEGTGKMFKLQNTKEIDDRKNVLKATDKALDYLKKLYNKYGDWALTLAAYNCGDGRLDKAIRAAGGVKDYWVVSQHLPGETKKYVPRFLGAAYLMNYYYLHDLKPSPVSEELRYTVSVYVDKKLDLKKLGKALDLDKNIIHHLNPMYKKDYVPAPEGNEKHVLTLPDSKIDLYFEIYGASQDLAYNPISQKRNNQILEEKNIGTVADVLLLPLFHQSRRKNQTLASNDSSETSLLKRIMAAILPLREKYTLYKLGKKESLNDVALSRNISLENLMAINNIGEDDEIPPGSIIIISKL